MVDANTGLFQNLNAAFALESPRPFERIQRPASALGLVIPTVITEIVSGGDSDGVIEDTYIQHERAGLSPSTSQCSSPTGEPAGSA